jgi:hypothetical protein
VRAPVLPVVAASRAGGNPNDTVVLQRGAEIHWGPALRRVVEDAYCFQLKRLPSSGEIRTFSLAWDRSTDAEGIAQLPNLKPGTYELAKGSAGPDGACRLDADGVPAWVVLAAGATFHVPSPIGTATVIPWQSWRGRRDADASVGSPPRGAFGIADSLEVR